MLIYVDAVTAASFHSQNLGPILQTMYWLWHIFHGQHPRRYTKCQNPEQQQFKG